MTDNIYQKRIEELILILLISMNVLEFFGFLPGEAGFIKTVSSMSAIGYVLYKASLSEIFFGKKNKGFDTVIVFCYFLLIVNKFVEFSFISALESKYFADFFLLVVNNSILIDTVGFVFGNLSIIFISLIFAFSLEIKEPSILSALHVEQKSNFIKKFIACYLVFIGFYLIFFNLIMEWMTLVLDAPLIIVAIFLYIFKIHEHTKSLDSDVIIFKVGDFIEDLVNGTIKLFHSKNTIFLGITGLIVLHLVTDFMVFIVPYNIGINTNIYLADEHNGEAVIPGSGHKSLPLIFNEDKSFVKEPIYQVFLLFSYAMNTAWITLFLLFPGFVWYVLYRQKAEGQNNAMNFPTLILALFYSSLVFLFFLRVYDIGSLGAEEGAKLFGVDITTKSIASLDFVSVSVMSVFVFILVLILSNLERLKDIFFRLMTIVAIVYFGFHIYNFYQSQIFVNSSLISDLLSESVFLEEFVPALGIGIEAAFAIRFFIIGFSIIYMAAYAILYCGGFFSFVSHAFSSK